MCTYEPYIAHMMSPIFYLLYSTGIFCCRATAVFVSTVYEERKAQELRSGIQNKQRED